MGHTLGGGVYGEGRVGGSMGRAGWDGWTKQVVPVGPVFHPLGLPCHEGPAVALAPHHCTEGNTQS